MFVLIGDVLKGIVACPIGLRLGVYVYLGEAVECITLLAAGAGAFIGHNWPVYFGFKGGKGALTAVAVLFMFDWVMALICLNVFLMIVALTRFISLGTISATVLFMAISFVPIFHHTFYFHIFTLLTAVIIIFKHKDNLQRLLLGRENKLSLSRY
jgi:acyl phosphate:glycerol-3-phosphate acyltransferase